MQIQPMANPAVSLTPPSAHKLIGDKNDFLVVIKNVEKVNVSTPASNRTFKATSGTTTNKTAKQNANQTSFRPATKLMNVTDNINQNITKTSKKVEELEKNLQRYLNHSENVMNALASLTTKFSQLERKVNWLLNTTKSLNRSLISSYSKLEAEEGKANQIIEKLKINMNNTALQMQQALDQKLTQISSKIQHVQNLQSSATRQQDLVNKTIYSFQQSLTQELQSIKITSNQTGSELNSNIQEIANQISRLEGRVNSTSTNISFFQSDFQETDETYLKNFVNRQNSLLQNRIRAVEHQLHSSVEQSAVAANRVQSEINQKVSTYGERLNQTLRIWVENEIQDEEKQIENLKNLLNSKIQQGAELQNKVQILDAKAAANNANTDKFQKSLSEFSQKLAGTYRVFIHSIITPIITTAIPYLHFHNEFPCD